MHYNLGCVIKRIDNFELMGELLAAHCDYQLFRIKSFAGPELSPVALMGTAVSGVGGLIFSPDFLRKEFFPFAAKIVDAQKQLGYNVIFEMEGDTRIVFDDIVSSGADGYAAIEELSGMSAAWVKSNYPKLTVAQMIDSVQLLTYGSKEQVIEKTKDMVELSRKYNGVLIGSSGDINEEVNIENAMAMFETINNTQF